MWLGLLGLLACAPSEDAADTGAGQDVDGDGYDATEDCDDLDADVHPGAAESCRDRDRDCDGYPGACGTAPMAWIDEENSSLHGEVGVGGLGQYLAVGDLDGDGTDEVVTSDWRGTDLLVWSGATGVVGQGGESFRLRTPFSLSSEGASVAVGDFDGDGHVDVAAAMVQGNYPTLVVFRGPVSASSSYEDTPHYFGALFNLGDLDGDGAEELAASNGSYITVVSGPELAEWGSIAIGGATCMAGGDVDGDGSRELLVGVESGGSGVAAGEVLLFSGPSGDLSEDDAVGTVVGTVERQRIGASCALADYDGDGTDDVIVGAPGSTDGTEPGRVLVYPQLLGAQTFEQAATIWSDVDTRSMFGRSVLAVDIDGDGASELVVGGPGYSGRGGDGGALAVLPGKQTGALNLHDGRRLLLNPDGLESLGAPAALGDLDGDGRLEAVVGAPLASRDDLAVSHEGAVFRIDLE